MYHYYPDSGDQVSFLRKIRTGNREGNKSMLGGGEDWWGEAPKDSDRGRKVTGCVLSMAVRAG
jgi:hypothetical protein